MWAEIKLFRTTFYFLRLETRCDLETSYKVSRFFNKRNWLMTSFFIFLTSAKIGFWSVHYTAVTWPSQWHHYFTRGIPSTNFIFIPCITKKVYNHEVKRHNTHVRAWRNTGIFKSVLNIFLNYITREDFTMKNILHGNLLFCQKYHFNVLNSQLKKFDRETGRNLILWYLLGYPRSLFKYSLNSLLKADLLSSL